MISETSYENNENTILSESYTKSLQKVVGSNLIKLPPNLYEQRKQYWENFFWKYSESTSDNAAVNNVPLNSNTRERLHKPLSDVQHWVNTGFFPYNKKQFNMDEDKRSDCYSVSELENYSKSPQRVVEETANERPNQKFSSSSVDTTAYILSNMNVTKKAETMAIVEGAKSDAVERPQNIRSTSAVHENICENISDKTTCEQTNNKDTIFDDNSDNCQQSSTDADSRPALTRDDDGAEEITAQPETNLDADVSQSTLSNDDVDDALSRSDYNKLIYDRLAQTLNSPYRKYSTERNPLNVDLTYRTQGFTTPRKHMKTGHRKKLYTGRDSPVDLVDMRSCNTNSLSKTRHSLHPALDFGYKLTKNNKAKKIKRIRSFSLFNNTSHLFKPPRRRKKKLISKRNSTTTTNSSKTNETIVNSKDINNSKDDKRIKRNLVQNLEISSSSVSKKNQFKSTLHLRKMNGSKQLTDLIPVVDLIKLTEDEIKRYTRPNKATVDNLNKSETRARSHKNGYRKRSLRLQRKQKKEAKARSPLTRLSNIQNYKDEDNVTANLCPVVYLKRLSDSEIQKYKTFVNKGSNNDNSKLTGRVKRLSASNIEKYKDTNDKKLSETRILQDESIIKNKLLRYSQSINLPISELDVINVLTEDSSSDSSTLLFYKCDKTEHSKSNINNRAVTSQVQPKSDVIKRSTKSIRRKRNNKKEQKVRDKADKEIIEVEQNRRSERRKVAKNQTSETRETSENLNGMRTKYGCGSESGCDSCTPSHRYKTRSQKPSELHSINNSHDLMKDMKQIKNSLTASEKLICKEMVRRNNTSTDSNNTRLLNKNNSKELSHNLLSSDEDDFVKLLHCPEDVRKQDLKQRYKMLTQEFNNVEKRMDNDELHTVHKSTGKELCSSFITESSIIRREESFIRTHRKRLSSRSSNSSTKVDYRATFKETGSTNKNRQKVLVLYNTSVKKTESKTTRLCFKTRLFESDSESSNVSTCSPNKFLLRDEE